MNFRQTIDALGERVNPVLVKEVRQSFHNTWILVFAATVLFGELLIMLMLQSEVFSAARRGSVFFTLLLCILTGGGMLIGGAIPMQRFYNERKQSDLDYSTMTNLSGVQMVLGRLFSGALTILLLYAMCLPFMVISYFLGGVALTEMLATASFFFLVLLLVTQAGLLFGAAGSRIASVVFQLGLFIAGWVVILAALQLFEVSGVFGFALSLQTFVIAVSVTLLIGGLLFVLTVAAVLPRPANRMLPVRLYIFALWALIPALPAIWDVDVVNWQRVLEAWAVLTMLLIVLTAGIAACERDVQSYRVLRRTPGNFLFRAIFFLFSSGSGGGLCFAWLLFAGMAVMAGYGTAKNFWPVPLGWAALALFIGGLALVLRGFFRPLRRLPGPVLCLATAGLVFFVRLVLQLVAANEDWLEIATAYGVYIVLAGIVLLLNSAMILRQFGDCSRAVRERRAAAREESGRS